MRCIHLLTDWWAVRDDKYFILTGKSATNEVIKSEYIVGLLDSSSKNPIYMDTNLVGYLLDKPSDGFIADMAGKNVSFSLLMSNIDMFLPKFNWDDPKLSYMNGKEKLPPYKKGQIVFLKEQKAAFKDFIEDELGLCSIVLLSTREEVKVAIDEIGRHPSKEYLTEV